MKLVVARCRDYNDYDRTKKILDQFYNKFKNDLIILSGGAKGTDSLGERYAKENNLQLQVFPANWTRYGKKAGPIRNEQMAKACNAVLTFWDGKSKGTRSMLKLAKKYNKKIYIIKI